VRVSDAKRRACRRRDSNPHTRRHRNLNPACLPVPPLRLYFDCSARCAPSTRLAPGHAPTSSSLGDGKALSPPSFSARRGARSGFTWSRFAVRRSSLQMRVALGPQNSGLATRRLSAQGHECSSKRPLEPSFVALCGITRESAQRESWPNQRGGPTRELARWQTGQPYPDQHSDGFLAVPQDRWWLCGDRVTDAGRALICRRGRRLSRCTGRRRWCLDPSGRRRSQKSSG
jgi:hypothetical protein